MNNYSHICNIDKNLNKKFLCIFTLLVAMFVIGSFDNNVFAEKLAPTNPELSLGSNHLGSMITTQTVSSDGTVWIFVTYTIPVEREHMTVNVRFTDKNGQEITDVNYDIMITQNSQVILDETMVNHHTGIRDHLTKALPSNDNTIIEITLQGIGTVAPFTGPRGETIQVNVVPEFGTVAMMILSVSILSIIAVTAKSRIISKLN